MRIGERESEYYFFDKKIEYVSLNILIDRIGILAACTDQFLAKDSGKKPVKQILYQSIKKKTKYAAPKNIWFGK